MPGLPFSGGATKVLALPQMTVRYLKWYSPWLSREFEMLVFGNGGGLPLIIFPTSWRGHDWDYWRDMLPCYLSGL